MNMHDISDFLLVPQPDTRVVLDAQRLAALRHARGLSREAVSEQCLEHRKCLSVASITRAETGKPVLYLTARYLAEYYAVPLQTLLPAAPGAGTPGCADNEPSTERLQFGAAAEGILLSGRGRLIEACGPVRTGKSRLLAQCLDDARQRGFATVAVQLDARADGAADPVRTFMLRLLQLGEGAACVDAPAAAIRGRCELLAIPEPHILSLLGLLKGGESWPRPAVQRVQANALCMLIQRLAQQEPLVLALDDLHRADWAMAMTLETIVPPTLLFPVLWFVTAELSPSAPPHGVGTRLDGVPRSVFHLTRPAPQRAGEAGAATIHRIGFANRP
jgi:transcriptional regulator with XRE-family HTH domain